MASNNNTEEHLFHPIYRADIDGLRAVAVLSVIAFHASPDLVRGGFIGVDIFFVISGFLISTIIFRSLEQDNFSFFEFYSRRIRRIFPSLLLVLTACYSFGWFSLLAEEYKQLGKHIAAGAGFASNFILWNESGYFDLVAETKPLLHLWSLGIEEQYYVIWPLLLWIAQKLRLNFLLITIAVAGISFFLNIIGIQNEAVATFYSPQTRFWELLAGSALAYFSLYNLSVLAAARHKSELLTHRSLSNVLSASGILLITVSLLTITKERAFPGWLALFPTLGAVLTISAGSQAWINRQVLSNRVLVWFGLISFPLYLWHWPLLSFARILENETPSPELRTAAVLVAVSLAWLTYRFVEIPIRHGKYGLLKSVFLFVLMFVVGFLGFNCYKSDGLASRSLLQQSAGLLSWPDENVATKPCRYTFPKSVYCLVADENKLPTIALFGDSHANHFYFGLSAEYSKINENLVQLGSPGCPPIIDVTSRFSGQNDVCRSNDGYDSDYTLKTIAEQSNVHTVILAANWHLYLIGTRFINSDKCEIRSLSNPALQGNLEVFQAQMKETISLLKQHGKNIIVIKQIPELNFSPAGCIVKRPIVITKLQPQCTLPATVALSYLNEYESKFDELFSSIEGVTIWDPKKYLCDEKFCYVLNGKDSLYRDHIHLSLSGSEFFAKNLKVHK